MKIFGLTGGIASGKSTVATMLSELGCPIVDADQVARGVVRPGTPALAEIIEQFGPDIVDDTGRLRRDVLGSKVFSDKTLLHKLNSITHPRIAAETAKQFAELAQAGQTICVYDVPLLFENNLEDNFAGVIVTSVPEDIQRQRLKERDQLSDSEISDRISSQMPLSVKAKKADYLIDNSGSLPDTQRQVESLWQVLNSAS